MKCPNPICQTEIQYHWSICEVCGRTVGYPNVRKAQGMRADLDARYRSAIDQAKIRGVIGQVQELEMLLQKSVATINIRPKDIDILSLAQPYFGYHKSTGQGLRKIAEEEYHAHRKAVDAKVCAGYETEIVCAAISPHGRGLTNYGPIAVQLRSVALQERASVLRENSFNFYDSFDLGRRGSKEEAGWRSTWPDRALLGVAYLAKDIDPSMDKRQIADTIFNVGHSRDADRYMEVQIFGSVTMQAIESVLLERPLTTPDEQHTWECSRERLVILGISVTP